MNSKFKIVTTLLMFILILLLIGIVVNYYNEPVEIRNDDILQASKLTNPSIDKVISQSVSGEKLSSDNESFISNISGEVYSGDLSGDMPIENEQNLFESVGNKGSIVDKYNNGTSSKDSNPKGQVIISSEDAMTNKEKRQILTELDNTLMELLDVVDKVQTVDESRLITDESGVQE